MSIHVNKKPNEPLPPLVAEFVKFVLSKEGQQVVEDDGFGKMPVKAAADSLKKIQ